MANINPPNTDVDYVRLVGLDAKTATLTYDRVKGNPGNRTTKRFKLAVTEEMFSHFEKPLSRLSMSQLDSVIRLHHGKAETCEG